MARCIVCGVNCTKIGKGYAATLLSKATARLEDVPELQGNKAYRRALAAEKDAIHSNILHIAREELAAAGYSHSIIDKVLADKIPA